MNRHEDGAPQVGYLKILGNLQYAVDFNHGAPADTGILVESPEDSITMVEDCSDRPAPVAVGGDQGIDGISEVEPTGAPMVDSAELIPQRQLSVKLSPQGSARQFGVELEVDAHCPPPHAVTRKAKLGVL